MLNIRPVSDLRNRFSEIEADIIEKEEPVFLTKNGYGSMVVMSLEQYSLLTDQVESKLDQANQQAQETDLRYSQTELFKRVRNRIDGK